MHAIVLAAGRGTRLQPLTDNRPKHLLEISGIPILKRILDQLSDISWISKIVIVVNYEALQIQDAVNSWFQNHDFKFVFQKIPNGTGGAVYSALIESNIKGDFIVINGDVIFGDRIKEIIRHYKESEADGLILGYRNEFPSSYGVLFQKDDLLQDLIEKPTKSEPNSIINAGVYIFSSLAIKLFSDIKTSKRGEKEITDVVKALILQGTKIRVQKLKSKWFDIGRPWEILDANEYFMLLESKSYKINGTIEPNVQTHGNVYIAPTARIRSGVYIEGPVYIDEGADIGPNCYIRSHTYLGRNTRIGNGCEIKNSIVYHETHIAHLSYVGDSVIGRRCNLGAGTITANLRHDGKNIKVSVNNIREDSGRRKLGVIFGDDVKTGIGVDILPGVVVSSNSWINAGEVISRDQ